MENTSGMKERARHMAEQQKEAGAEMIGGMAGAIHGAARELEGQMPKAASFVHDAADRLDKAATQLKERSVDDVLSGVNDFARSQPVAFFGGAVLAGFAITRFFKSSDRAGMSAGPRV